MKQFLLLLSAVCLVQFSFGQLIISGVVDGPLTGGVPKAVELYATEDIADLSIYGFGSANNGGGSDGDEFTLSGSASVGDYIYIASEIPFFNAFFGFDPNFNTTIASINGDDAIELFKNGVVIDVFGDIDTDGTGQTWEYMDGWAYRVNSTGPDGSTFTIDNWTFSGIKALDDETSNATASNPFPIGTYTSSGTPTETVSAPTFNPEEGTYSTTQNVSISCSTEGSSIYYTLDESTPDSTSTLYATSIEISASTIIKAIAYTNTLNSSVSTATYTLEISSTDASLPYEQNFTVDEGNFTTFSSEGDQVWNWTNYDGGSMVMSGYESSSYANSDWLISPTFDFSAYSNLELNYSEAINYITSYDDLQVLVSTNYDGSSVDTATWDTLTITGRPAGYEFTFEDVDAIDLSTYEGESTVTIAFKYTSSSTNSSTWEISKVSISVSEVIVIEEPSNHVTNFSATSSAVTQNSIELSWTENDGTDIATGYLIKASTETITDPEDGINPDDDTDLTDGSGNVKVLHGSSSYTFDNCSSGTTYNFSLYPYTATVDTIVYKISDAPTTSATTLEAIATPVISPLAGTYSDSVWVSLSCTTDNVVIYYTTDGETPTSSSMIYTDSLKLTERTTIKAIALKGENSSDIAESVFVVNDSQIVVQNPYFTTIAGNYPDSLEVTINCDTEGAVIYYTIDGTNPDQTSMIYTAPFTIYETTSIAALAIMEGNSSEFTVINYEISTTAIEVATPIISPESGEFADSVEISITCNSPDAIIFYTLDGTTPDNTSYLYIQSFQIKEDLTVKAIAFIESYSSSVTEAEYVVTETIAPIEVSTLAELRAGQTDGTVYHLNNEVLVTFAMDYRNQKYIQDETAALLIDDYEGIITTSFEIGNGLSDLSGTLSDYYGLLEFIPTSDATKNENSSLSIEPQTITITEFKSNFDNYESELIRFSHVQFSGTGLFANGTDYVISNESESTILRTHFYDVDYIASSIFSDIVNVSGIALWNQDEGKIVPRSTSDMEDATGILESSLTSKIYNNDKTIIIDNVSSANKVDIYTMDGQKIKSVKINDDRNTIEIYQSGIFLIVLSNNQQIQQSQKLVIQ
jgi:hypothetical protein